VAHSKIVEIFDVDKDRFAVDLVADKDNFAVDSALGSDIVEDKSLGSHIVAENIDADKR
jgi:hypothetical protein